MSRRYQVADGIVLRRKALPSGDLVATLLSEHGKWRTLARKGKLPGGNLGRLSLFHDVTVQYYRRKDDDLALATQVQLNGALPNLSRPEIYPYAHLLAELTDKLTVDVHIGERIYGYFSSGLRGLNRHPDPELVALVYAWKLLGLAGLAPRVTRCGRCDRREGLTFLDIAAGGLCCGSCRTGLPLGGAVAADLQLLVGASTGDALAGVEAERGERPEHWRVLARYLAYHAGELQTLSILVRSDVAGEEIGQGA